MLGVRPAVAGVPLLLADDAPRDRVLERMLLPLRPLRSGMRVEARPAALVGLEPGRVVADPEVVGLLVTGRDPAVGL